MKKYFKICYAVILLVVISSCSHQTSPQFRISNGRLDKISLNVQPSAGNKYSINDIESGQTTSYQTTSEGTITITDIIHNESLSFPSKQNTHYLITFLKDRSPVLVIEK